MGMIRGVTMSLLICVTVAWTADPRVVKGVTIGTIHRLDPRVDQLLPKDATVEILAEGFDWTEGPVWVRDGGFLLFSDIPQNSVMRWHLTEGVSTYLKPSGYTGLGKYSDEPGCNGMLLDKTGQLVAFEHGDRRVSVLTKGGGKRTLADSYQGKRFNSPNDGVFMSNGDLYFTDPPYGLPKRFDDPMRELDFCGVYRLKPTGELTLLTKEMKAPNGIGLAPDEKTLYVAQSDKVAIWKSFPVQADGTIGAGKVFADVSEVMGKKPGAPDGMVIDQKGNLFATGPGGVYIFAPDGKQLGLIETNDRTANCKFGGDGSTLYMTINHRIGRIQTTTKGIGY